MEVKEKAEGSERGRETGEGKGGEGEGDGDGDGEGEGEGKGAGEKLLSTATKNNEGAENVSNAVESEEKVEEQKEEEEEEEEREEEEEEEKVMVEEAVEEEKEEEEREEEEKVMVEEEGKGGGAIKPHRLQQQKIHDTIVLSILPGLQAVLTKVSGRPLVPFFCLSLVFVCLYFSFFF